MLSRFSRFESPWVLDESNEVSAEGARCSRDRKARSRSPTNPPRTPISRPCSSIELRGFVLFVENPNSTLVETEKVPGKRRSDGGRDRVPGRVTARRFSAQSAPLPWPRWSHGELLLTAASPHRYPHAVRLDPLQLVAPCEPTRAFSVKL